MSVFAPLAAAPRDPSVWSPVFVPLTVAVHDTVKSPCNARVLSASLT